MPYILVRHKVENFEKWKQGFDEHGSTRQANGSKGGFVFRNTDNPSEVLALIEWDEIENARNFAQSADLKEKMQEVGIVDQPDIYFLDIADQITK
jgi:hypothetical protein